MTAGGVSLVSINGCRLHYEDTGSSLPPIVFSHGLLWSGKMFEAQVRALSNGYRCVTYDHRGQGRSDKPRGTISIEQCYDDAVTLIERLGLAPCHFVGLSMGGFVGLRLAIRRPDLLRSVILLESSADPEPKENVSSYRVMNLIARAGLIRAVAPKVMRIMFGDSFLTDPLRQADRDRWLSELVANPRSIHRAVTGVIERRGVYDELGVIRTPTLIVVGEEDTATVPAKSERMRDRIAGAELVRIPRAGHTSSVEEPEAVNRAISAFLAEL
jgi:3-oxoadipate enol-lactonase